MNTQLFRYVIAAIVFLFGSSISRAIDIVTPSLPAGMEMSAYNGSLQATNGLPPYTWSVLPIVVAWGDNSHGQINVPQELSNITAIAGGGRHSLALKSDGHIVAWGDNAYGQTLNSAEETNVSSEAKGVIDSLWFGGQCDVMPVKPGSFKLIINGGADGQFVDNGAGVLNGFFNIGGTNMISASGIINYDTGVYLIVAGPAGGNLIGRDVFVSYKAIEVAGSMTITSVDEIAAGGRHSLALKADGTMYAWGDNQRGQANSPSFTLVVSNEDKGNIPSTSFTGQCSLSPVKPGSFILLINNGSDGVFADDGSGVLHGSFNVGGGVLIYASGTINYDTGAYRINLGMVGGIMVGKSVSITYVQICGINYFVATNVLGEVKGAVPSTSFAGQCYLTPVKPRSFSLSINNGSAGYFTDDGSGVLHGSFNLGGGVMIPATGTIIYATGFFNLNLGVLADSVIGNPMSITYTKMVEAGIMPTVSGETKEVISSTSFAGQCDRTPVKPGFFSFLINNGMGGYLTDNENGRLSGYVYIGGGVTNAALGTITYGSGAYAIDLGSNGSSVSGMPVSLTYSLFPGVISTAITNISGENKGIIPSTSFSGKCSHFSVSPGSFCLLINDGIDGQFIDDGAGVLTGVFNIGGGIMVSASGTLNYDNGNYEIVLGVGAANVVGKPLSISYTATVEVIEGGIDAAAIASAKIAGGGSHSLLLQSDGTVVAWGDNASGQTNVPPGLSNVVSVAAGQSHSLALRFDGTVVAWGDNASGQTNVPSGLSNVVAIAGGNTHSLALAADGTVVAWGDNTLGQTNVPSGLSNVVAIAAGGAHCLALKSDGTVVAWGDNAQGQAHVPSELTQVVMIAGGGAHSLALRSKSSELPEGLFCSPDGAISAIPTLASTNLVTFVVTDSIGSSTNITFEIAIEPNPNTRPVISSKAPEAGSLNLPEGANQAFAVMAHDPEGSNITYAWTWDGVAVGVNSQNYTNILGWGNAGLHVLRCYVSDDSWSNVVYAEWTVSLLDDNDWDGVPNWREVDLGRNPNNPAGTGLPSSLSGMVRGEGVVISNAYVELSGISNRVYYQTYTDSTGFYSVNDVLPGNYFIKVGAAQFADVWYVNESHLFEATHRVDAKTYSIAANSVIWASDFNLAFGQNPALVEVTSEPAGAAIYLDYQPTAKVTPAVLNVGEVGEMDGGGYHLASHVISLNLEDHPIPSPKGVAAREAETVSMHFDMTSSAEGSLSITTVPEGATVFVDTADAVSSNSFSSAATNAFTMHTEVVSEAFSGYSVSFMTGFQPINPGSIIVNFDDGYKGSVTDDGFGHLIGSYLNAIPGAHPANGTVTYGDGQVIIFFPDILGLSSRVTIQYTVGNKSVWISPVTLGNLAPGLHAIHIKKAGYLQPRPVIASVQEGLTNAISIPLTIITEPDKLIADVRSVPHGATIFVDYQPETNVTDSVVDWMDSASYAGAGWSSTNHTIMLRKSGYFPSAARYVPNLTNVTQLMVINLLVDPAMAVDEDFDGMPDQWEDAYRLREFAAEQHGADDDPDQDGFSNMQEMRAGTNPFDGTSHLSVAAVGVSAPGPGQTVTFMFSTVPGRSYILQGADDLAGGWTNLSGLIQATQYQTAYSVLLPEGKASQFYRLIVLAP